MRQTKKIQINHVQNNNQTKFHNAVTIFLGNFSTLLYIYPQIAGGQIILDKGSTIYISNELYNTAKLNTDITAVEEDTQIIFDDSIQEINGGAHTWSIADISFGKSARLYGAGSSNGTTANVSLTLGGSMEGAIYASGHSTANKTLGDVSLTITDNSKTLGNVFAGASMTNAAGSFNAQSITTQINGGTFGKVTGNGTLIYDANTASSGSTTQGDSALTINGGTFNSFVYAGAFSTGNTATVNGNCSLVINGGTFNSYVLGGCTGLDTACANQTVVNGDITVTVNCVSDISFARELVVGNKGRGTINGDTSLVFTGSGEYLNFADDVNIYGGDAQYWASDKGSWFGAGEYQNQTSSLIFKDFTGTMGAAIDESFTNVSLLDGSRVNLSATTNLAMVNVWELEIGANNNDSSQPMLSWTDGCCDFNNDTLVLTFDDDVELFQDNLVVMDFGDATVKGWNGLSVNLFGTVVDAEHYDSTAKTWTAGDTILRYNEESKQLFLSLAS